MKIGFARAERILDGLEKRGIIGPAKGKNDPGSRAILKFPNTPPGLITVKIGDELEIVDTSKPTPAPSPTTPSGGTEIKPEEKPKLTLGLPALRAF